MVPGLEKFREHFKGHSDSYALIGGAACSLIFEEVGVDFRATKDLDMVLCVEVVDASFAEALKSFLNEGGYQARERAEGQREFYRFHKPTDSSYPEMLELFSTKANILDLADGDELATVPVTDDVLSLSAILLEPDYYEALVASRREIDGVHVLDETLLIPFKARAFIDLSGRREGGDTSIKGHDIKKHRNDVFRLMQLLTEDQVVEVAESLRGDLRGYIERVGALDAFKPEDFKVQIDRDEGIELLQTVYKL